MPSDYKLIDIADKKLNVIYTGKRIYIPSEVTEVVNTEWAKFEKTHPNLYNGDVFCISNININEQEINIEISQTKFALLGTTKYKLPDICNDYIKSSIFTATLLKTKDNFLVIAEGSNQALHPGRLKFIGGLIDESDIVDGKVYSEYGAIRELAEELGIKASFNMLSPAFLKIDNDRRYPTGIIYLVNLEFDKESVIEIFNKHDSYLKNKYMEREILSPVFIPANIEAIDKFEAENTKEIKNYVLDILRETCKTLKIS